MASKKNFSWLAGPIRLPGSGTVCPAGQGQRTLTLQFSHASANPPDADEAEEYPADPTEEDVLDLKDY